jgi:hypothetical protein
MSDRRWDSERQEWVYPGDWRPIETAPNNVRLLVYDSADKETYIASLDSQHGFWWICDDANMALIKPTRWTYLPEPPDA